MLKLSDIVTRDETICSLNFCWNQYSLLCDTFITLFHIEKATKQCKCVLRKKACTIFPKTPWSFLFRKIRSFSWLDGEGLGNFWRRNTVCWWYGCCGFPQDSCFQYSNLRNCCYHLYFSGSASELLWTSSASRAYPFWVIRCIYYWKYQRRIKMVWTTLIDQTRHQSEGFGFIALHCTWYLAQLVFFFTLNTKALLIWGWHILLDLLQTQVILQFWFVLYHGPQNNHTVTWWNNSSSIIMHQAICHTKWFLILGQFTN